MSADHPGAAEQPGLPPELAPLATPAQRRANRRLGLLLGAIAIGITVIYMLLLPGRFAQAARWHAARKAELAAEPAPAAPATAPSVPPRGSP